MTTTTTDDRTAIRLCDFPDCGRQHRARGYCQTHYDQLKAGKELRPIRPRGRHCSVDGCDEKHHAKGLCHTHYVRARDEAARAARSPKEPMEPKTAKVCERGDCGRVVRAKGLCDRHHRLKYGKPCTFPGCPDKQQAKGLCPAHWAQQRDGKKLETRQRPWTLLPTREDCHDLAEWISYRIRVDESTGCWLWTGRAVRNGYGKLWGDERNEYVHRWSYGTFVGSIPEGWHVDHSPGCSSTLCCNPSHLQAIPPEEHKRVTKVRRDMLAEAGDEWAWVPPRQTRTLRELGALAEMGNLGNIEIIRR